LGLRALSWIEAAAAADRLCASHKAPATPAAKLSLALPLPSPPPDTYNLPI